MINITFKVDGGKKLGMGHINRCITVANELRKKNVHCTFLISNKLTKKYIEDRNFSVKIIRSDKEYLNDIIKFVKKENIHGLIIDSKKRFSNNEIKRLSKQTKIIFIDNKIESDHIELTVLPGLKEQFNKISSRSIVGQEYVLLNPDFKYYKMK